MDVEAELVLRIGEGDDHALKELYGHLAGNVFALAVQMLGSREDAEEVLQDTFVKLHKSARRFDVERGSARAYLYTIARNEARMRLRARSVRPTKLGEIDLHDSRVHFEAPASGDPDTQLTVHRALEQLDPEDARLVKASFLQGYPHKDIAEHSGLPLGTVKSRIRRALQKLRDLLEGS